MKQKAFTRLNFSKKNLGDLPSTTLGSGKSGAGFTLIEILVVVSIIIVLSVIVLADYEFGGYQLSLQRSVHKLAQDIRTAEEMAMSAKSFAGAMPVGGYGIYLEHQTSTYILFADINGNGVYWTAGSGYETNERVEILELENNTEITMLCLDPMPCACSSRLSIVFIPPDPIIKFNDQIATSCSAVVTFGSSKIDQESNLFLRPTGLIEIE